MYAAPTAQKDFQLLAELKKLGWKEQLVFLDEIRDKLKVNSNPELVEICFLEMLQEKNVNVLLKVLKLIHSYVQLFGIRTLSLRELTLSLLNLSGSPQMFIEEIIHQLLTRFSQDEPNKELIFKGILDSLEGFSKDKNFSCIIKVLNTFLKMKEGTKILQNPLFWECLETGFSNLPDTSADYFLQFFKTLTDYMGANALLMARKLGYNEMDSLKKYLVSEGNKQNISNIDVEYFYKLKSQEWFEDYKHLPIKSICLTLKEASKNDRGIDLSFELLESLEWLAHRKNKNQSKCIYDVVISSISRHTVTQFKEPLFRILFLVINNKRILKEFEQEKIEFKNELWLSTVEDEYLLKKIEVSNLQEDYHRVLILIGLKKHQEGSDIKQLCESLIEKENLNLVYRVQAEHILKEQC